MSDGHRGVIVYVATTLGGVTAFAGLLSMLDVSIGDNRAAPLVLAAMWTPAFGRFVATTTVDRTWRPTFPLGRWGASRSAVVLVPLGIVCAIYGGSYALSALWGIQREPPIWTGRRAALNVIINFSLLSIIGTFGSLGEELGWRGYLQPRLDQLGVRASILWLIVVESLFHLPVIVLAGYLSGPSLSTTIALFFALSVGVTPVWTWATYRWRTIWIAVWFHAFHNVISQVILPRALGEGDPRLLGESGIFPVALYVIAAVVVFSIVRARGERWRDLAREAGVVS